jgi:hypothetical protein
MSWIPAAASRMLGSLKRQTDLETRQGSDLKRPVRQNHAVLIRRDQVGIAGEQGDRLERGAYNKRECTRQAHFIKPSRLPNPGAC